jgi:hypothetical protein
LIALNTIPRKTPRSFPVENKLLLLTVLQFSLQSIDNRQTNALDETAIDLPKNMQLYHIEKDAQRTQNFR